MKSSGCIHVHECVCVSGVCMCGGACVRAYLCVCGMHLCVWGGVCVYVCGWVYENVRVC